MFLKTNIFLRVGHFVHYCFNFNPSHQNCILSPEETWDPLVKDEHIDYNPN